MGKIGIIVLAILTLCIRHHGHHAVTDMTATFMVKNTRGATQMSLTTGITAVSTKHVHQIMTLIVRPADNVKSCTKYLSTLAIGSVCDVKDRGDDTAIQFIRLYHLRISSTFQASV